MAEHRYRLLIRIAIIMTVAWIGWSIYDGFLTSKEPGQYAYHAATNYFADGNYAKALQEYEKALSANPDLVPALRGRAETLIMLDRERKAIEIYDELIALEPEQAGFYYANRGIAHDRLGDHRAALADYETALRLDAEVGKGPSWLTRFLRKQPEKPPGIAERARYLKTQLALPASERVLSVPEIDAEQRPYKK